MGYLRVISPSIFRMQFDGMILYLPHKLPEHVTTCNVTTRQEEQIAITITFTNVIPENSPQVLQFVNIKTRNMFRILGYQQIGKNFFDPKRKIDIPAHHLQVNTYLV